MNPFRRKTSEFIFPLGIKPTPKQNSLRKIIDIFSMNFLLLNSRYSRNKYSKHRLRNTFCVKKKNWFRLIVFVFGSDALITLPQWWSELLSYFMRSRTVMDEWMDRCISVPILLSQIKIPEMGREWVLGEWGLAVECVCIHLFILL